MRSRARGFRKPMATHEATPCNKPAGGDAPSVAGLDPGAFPDPARAAAAAVANDILRLQRCECVRLESGPPVLPGRSVNVAGFLQTEYP